MASSIPSTMHAWTHTSRGAPSKVLHLVSNQPVRHPKKPTELLVKISYAALNPGGVIMMHFVPFLFRHSPAVPEMDFSGTVVEVCEAEETDALLGNREDDDDGGRLKVGDQVFGSIPVPQHVGGGHGTLADYAVVEAAYCVKRPAGTKMEDIAGLGVAGSTALVLIRRAGLKKGDSVLINAAAGGIGSIVVQLARGIVGESGRVVGVCSGRNQDLVLGLGANEAIDYSAKSSVTSYLAKRYSNEKFNVVIDCIGIQEFWEHSASYLIEEGPFVTVGIVNKGYTLSSMLSSVWFMMLKNPLLPVWLGGVPRRYERVTGLVDEESMLELGRLVEAGELKGVAGQIWEMEDVKRAYDILVRKKARGKLIIRIGG